MSFHRSMSSSRPVIDALNARIVKLVQDVHDGHVRFAHERHDVLEAVRTPDVDDVPRQAHRHLLEVGDQHSRAAGG
jgi:hypothetical protein